MAWNKFHNDFSGLLEFLNLIICCPYSDHHELAYKVIHDLFSSLSGASDIPNLDMKAIIYTQKSFNNFICVLNNLKPEIQSNDFISIIPLFGIENPNLVKMLDLHKESYTPNLPVGHLIFNTQNDNPVLSSIGESKPVNY